MYLTKNLYPKDVNNINHGQKKLNTLEDIQVSISM